VLHSKLRELLKTNDWWQPSTKAKQGCELGWFASPMLASRADMQDTLEKLVLPALKPTARRAAPVLAQSAGSRWRWWLRATTPLEAPVYFLSWVCGEWPRQLISLIITGSVLINVTLSTSLRRRL